MPADTPDPRDPRPRATAARPTIRERAGDLCLRGAARLLGSHPVLLEYPPPDGDRARWGWGSAPNKALHELMARDAARYGHTLELIDEVAADLVRIPAAHPEAGGQLPTTMLSVDPQPRAEVDLVCDEVERTPLEAADPRRVAALASGDVLLIDSSHYALQGSDVVAFFLDVLPALPAAVLVGIHDVFLPDDYPWWLSRWYAEQYLLATWLLGAAGRVGLIFPAHFCATDPQLRTSVDGLWERCGLPWNRLRLDAVVRDVMAT